MADGAASSSTSTDLGFDFDWFLRDLWSQPSDDLPFPPSHNDYEMENANADFRGKGLGEDSGVCAYYSSSSPGPSSPNPRHNNPTVVDVPHSSAECSVKAEVTQSSKNPNQDQNPHSDSDPKRLTRLIKNREAASQSRKRKKSYVQDLESKCRMWENYCNQLKQSIAFTCAENAILRDELNRIKRQKSSNGVAEPAVHKDSLPSESPSRLTTLVDAGYLTVVHCLGWLLVALILLFPGKAVKPSMTRTNTEYKSSIFRVFFNLLQKRRVFESFPGTRNRAFSSCRHHNWMLNNNFSPSYSVCHLA